MTIIYEWPSGNKVADKPKEALPRPPDQPRQKLPIDQCLIVGTNAARGLEVGHRLILIGAGIASELKVRPDTYEEFVEIIRRGNDRFKLPIHCAILKMDEGLDFWVAIRSSEAFFPGHW